MTKSHAEAHELLAHAGWIRALARRLVGDGPAADDLVQETWLAALKRPPANDRPLRPWLARVARNFARQGARRSQGRPPHEVLDEERASDCTPADLVLRGELQAKLVQHVLALREPLRATVLLRFYEGLESDAIARIQHIERATVRSRLKRAIDELRTRLDADHGGDRRTWVHALTPFATPSLLGVLMTTTTGKITVTAGAVALLVCAGYGVRELIGSAPPTNARAPAVAGELRAPTEARSETERAPDARREPSRAAREEAALAPTEANPPGAFWAGALRDADTGEPLPHYLFELRRDGQTAELTTDARGRFRTEERHTSGAFEARYRDHRGLALVTNLDRFEGAQRAEVWRPVEFDAADATPRELLVAAGPTYPLEVRSAAPVPLQALSAVVLGPDLSFRNTLGSLYAAPVRAGSNGAADWVRFQPLPRDLLPNAAPWRLTLFDDSGLWAGSADVDSLRGVNRETTVVELAPHGRVAGVVRDGARRPVVAAPVRLLAADSDAVLHARTDADGGFDVRWVEPGAYQLVIEPPRHASRTLALTVRPLEFEEVDVTLRERDNAGDVRGTLTSRTGTYGNRVFVLLDGRSSGAPDLKAELDWSDHDGELRAEYAFEDLPPGEYAVSVVSLLDKFTWSPAPRTVRPPARVDFEVADDAPTGNVSFEVVDAETGAAIEPFVMGYSAAGSASVVLRGMGAEGPHIYDLALDARLRFGVSSTGYAPSFGDETDLDFGAARDATVRVELRRGWGATFVVVDAETKAGVAGAAIELDGRAVATTDDDGRASVYSASPPREVRARLGRREGAAADYETLKFAHTIELR